MEHLKHAETTKAACLQLAINTHERYVELIPVMIVHLLETYVDCLANQSYGALAQTVQDQDITYCMLSLYHVPTRHI